RGVSTQTVATCRRAQLPARLPLESERKSMSYCADRTMAHGCRQDARPGASNRLMEGNGNAARTELRGELLEMPRDRGVAFRAAAIRRQAILLDRVPVAHDERNPAARATRRAAF